MPFVTEDISDEDFLRYHISETCHGNRAESNRVWVIDRERDIYLRRAWINWQYPSDGYWSFYWKGVEGCVEICILDFISEENGWSTSIISVGLPAGIVEIGPGDVIRSDFMDAYRSHNSHSKANIFFKFK